MPRNKHLRRSKFRRRRLLGGPGPTLWPEARSVTAQTSGFLAPLAECPGRGQPQASGRRPETSFSFSFSSVVLYFSLSISLSLSLVFSFSLHLFLVFSLPPFGFPLSLVLSLFPSLSLPPLFECLSAVLSVGSLSQPAGPRSEERLRWGIKSAHPDGRRVKMGH